MLQDPENPYEEWEDFVWAANLEAARSQCEAIASEIDLTEVVNVTPALKKPSKSGNYKFICWFKTEKPSHDNSNH